MKFRSLALSLRVFHLRKQHQQIKASASQEVGNLFLNCFMFFFCYIK